ncbi:MAG: hypothetical protein DCO97_17895 [Marivita sp. XM-24bin2]|nr:MAG: hypothetical protein DCO97_17895 [Marivita sp. XM-24bin2]
MAVSRSRPTPCGASPPRTDGAQYKGQGKAITAHAHLLMTKKMLPSGPIPICANCDKMSFLTNRCTDLNQDLAT